MMTWLQLTVPGADWLLAHGVGPLMPQPLITMAPHNATEIVAALSVVLGGAWWLQQWPQPDWVLFTHYSATNRYHDCKLVSLSDEDDVTTAATAATANAGHGAMAAERHGCWHLSSDGASSTAAATRLS